MMQKSEKSVENNQYEMDSIEGAYVNIASESETSASANEPQHESAKLASKENPSSSMKSAGISQFEKNYSDDPHAVDKTKSNDGVYACIGDETRDSRDVDRDQPAQGNKQGVVLNGPQPVVSLSRGMLYIIVGLTVAVFLTAATSLVLSVGKVVGFGDSSSREYTCTGPTISSDQKYIQELKNQIVQLNKTNHDLQDQISQLKHNTSHELKELKKDVGGMGKSANTNNETQMTQLQETVNITIQGLNELKKEVRESASDMTRKQLMWRNFTSTELQQQKNSIANLTIQVKNSSKTIGPRGPPGYNGTQGSAGRPGSQGLPGPPAIGSNITLCTYMTNTSPGKTASRYARDEISVRETKGKKFLGVNCDTNDARVCLLSSTVGLDNMRTYKCKCSNTLGSGDSTMYCYIHYWEGQTNT